MSFRTAFSIKDISHRCLGRIRSRESALNLVLFKKKIPSRELTYPPKKAPLSRWCLLFTMVGYVSFLEGIFVWRGRFGDCFLGGNWHIWFIWYLNVSGHIIIFHQARFPWNKGNSLPKSYLLGAQVVWGRYNLTRYINVLNFWSHFQMYGQGNFQVPRKKKWYPFPMGSFP